MMLKSTLKLDMMQPYFKVAKDLLRSRFYTVLGRIAATKYYGNGL